MINMHTVKPASNMIVRWFLEYWGWALLQAAENEQLSKKIEINGTFFTCKKQTKSMKKKVLKIVVNVKSLLPVTKVKSNSWNIYNAC